MKYRTVIELICDATDKEEASNIAGEYLKGELDFGVNMRCKTSVLSTHRIVKYGASCLIALMIFSTLLLNVMLLGGSSDDRSKAVGAFNNTYTVMPALKTKHTVEFKKEWEEKKDEAILEYIKK